MTRAPMPASARSFAAALALAAALAGALPPSAAADPEDPARVAPAEPVADEKAKEAIDLFRRESDGADAERRRAAVEKLSRAGSPLVADALLEVALKDRFVPVRAEAFRGLLRQSSAAKAVGPKVARWLAESAAENRKAKARGDYGILLDPKTGEVDAKSEAGLAALAAKRERGRMLAEALRLLDALGVREKDTAEALRDCLEEGNDDAVVAALGMLGRWKEWTVLPDLQSLFDRYPDENGWESGSVDVDTGASGTGDQEAAKRRWTAKYGDPDKRRARPKVVRAIRRALLDITGEAIADPAALKEFRRRPDVKRRERAR